MRPSLAAEGSRKVDRVLERPIDSAVSKRKVYVTKRSETYNEPLVYGK